MDKIFIDFFENKIVQSLISLIICVLLYFVVKKVTNTILLKGELKNKIDKRQKTFIKLFDNIVKYLITIVAILIILQLNGVNVSSLLAGVGIISAIAGLALQETLKDIIMGSTIISNSFFNVGDIVIINGIEGKVLEVGLRTTKLRNIVTNDIFVVTNRNIDRAINESHDFYMKINAPYEKRVEEIERVIDEIIQKSKHNIQELEDINYIGISELAESSVQYLLEIKCVPNNRLKVKREINKIIKTTFDERNISIPYNKIDVHNI